MNLSAELTRFDMPPDLARWVNDTVSRLHRQAEDSAHEAQRLSAQLVEKSRQADQQEQILKARDLKIQALTLEVAHLRRIRYAVRSEALSGEQWDLFQETFSADIEAAQAKLEQLNPTPVEAPTQPRKRAHPGRQALPGHLPRIE